MGSVTAQLSAALISLHLTTDSDDYYGLLRRDCDQASFPTDWRRIADNHDLMQVLQVSSIVADMLTSLPICVYIKIAYQTASLLVFECLS